MDEQTVRRAAEALLEAAPEGSTVFLFGSYARGDNRPDSDVDFLVVEPSPQNAMVEMVRLRQALDEVIGSLLVPADVLVVSREQFEHWRNTPNTVYYEAATQGRSYGTVG